MKASNRTLWVLLCVLVVVVLVLAALLLSRFRGKDAAAVAIGGAVRLGGRRPKEKLGGAVGDIWTIPIVGAESLSVVDFNGVIGAPFFPAHQTTAHPNLVADWGAIRAAYNTLNQDMAAAYATDPSYGVTKGAVRTLAPGRGMAARSVGTWQNAYVSLDNTLNGLGLMVDTYKIDPPLDATPARFNALKARLVNGLVGQPPGAGALADLHGRMNATTTQAQVQASIGALAPLIAALPPPAVLAPLPAAAASIGALAAGAAVARGHDPRAEGTVERLRNAYVNVRAMWGAQRVVMPAGTTPLVNTRDASVANCERLVDAIIGQFTAAPSTGLVATQCKADQDALVIEIGNLVASGAWTRAQRRFLTEFLTAATELAFCLPPPPAPSAKTVAHAAGGANNGDFSAVGRHTRADDTAVTAVCDTFIAFMAWWATALTRSNPAQYPGGLPAALQVSQQMATLPALVDDLIDSYRVPPVPGSGWPAAVADQCARALIAINTAYGRFAALYVPPARGLLGGLFGAAPPWTAFENAVAAVPQIAPPPLVQPPLLNIRTLGTLPGLVYQHSQPTVRSILGLAGELNRFYPLYAGHGLAGPRTVRIQLRDAGNLDAAETAIATAVASLVALVAQYVNPRSEASPADSAAAAATALADFNTLALVLAPGPAAGLADRLVILLGRIQPVTPLGYEGVASKPLTTSQRLIHLTSTPDIEAHFSKEVSPAAHGALVLEAASESELDAKLARAPDVAARLYGLVVDKPGDLVALYKAVAINIGVRTTAEIKSKRADVANAATGRLYTATRLPTGGYYKQFRDYVKPALYDVA